MKYEKLPIHKWRPNLLGCLLLYLGVNGIENGEQTVQNIFFIFLSLYLLIMFSKIYKSSYKRLLSIEDLRVRKAIINEPKLLKNRIIRELYLLSSFTTLFYLYSLLDIGGELICLLAMYITYSFIKTINFHEDKTVKNQK